MVTPDAGQPDGGRATLEALLAEDVEAARAREQQAFDEFAGPLRGSIVLCGAGGLGRRCLAGLRRHGIEPLAFVDRNPHLWHTSVDGVVVLPPHEAAARFATTAVFVVTIWGARASDRMADRVGALRALGCQSVIPFGPLVWKYPDGVLPHYAVDLPHRVLQQRDRVLAAFDLWADATSRREYIAQVAWRLSFDFEGMQPHDLAAIYFPTGLLHLGPDEVFVDCGAFDGDTIRDFLAASSASFEAIHAFEPDPTNWAALSAYVAGLPPDVQRRVTMTRAAVADRPGRTTFSAGAGPASHVGGGDLEVTTVTLDEWLGDRRPTFIKMDIEGAEPEALAGAARLVRDAAPILAVSCYHRQDHLWSIPLLMRSMSSDYAFYLRPHDVESWDLVCYAIPHARHLSQAGAAGGRA